MKGTVSNSLKNSFNFNKQMTPGPGSYQNKNLKHSKSETGLKASSCFISKSMRDPYNIKEKGPPVGAYNIDQH